MQKHRGRSMEELYAMLPTKEQKIDQLVKERDAMRKQANDAFDLGDWSGYEAADYKANKLDKEITAMIVCHDKYFPEF